MKRTSLFIGLLAIILGFTFTSCQKEDSVAGNALITVVMDNTPETLTKSTINTAKTIYVDSGYVNIVAAELVATKDGEQYQKTVRTRSRVNLNSGAYEYPVEMELMKGDYSETKLALTLDQGDNVPAIVIYGTYYDAQNNPIPVKFVYNDSITIYTKLDSNLIVEDSVPAFVVYIAPPKWFKDVKDQMIADAQLYDGVLLITDTTNVDIYNAIVQNIGKSCYMQAQNRDRWENMNEESDHDDNNM